MKHKIEYVGGVFGGCLGDHPGVGRNVHVTILNSAVSKDDNLPSSHRRGVYRLDETTNRMVWEALP